MFAGDVKFAAEECKKLVGFQIVGVCQDPENESYGLIIERDPHGEPIERKLCWIDRDPEGNGPGWLQVEDA